MTHVVLPGTYDPVTLGHMDVIRRATKLFPHVTVGVAASRGKRGVGTMFSLEERVDLMRCALNEAGLERVDVRPFEGLLVDFCREVGAHAVVKGLRTATDFEYELTQADLNARLAPDLESVFIMANPSLGCISSSVVRELSLFGASVDDLVPANVARRLKERCNA